jgi:Peptidase M50B-like
MLTWLSAAVPALQSTHHVTPAQIVGAGVIAGIVLLIRIVRYATTVAHEGGHALLLAFFGVPIKGIWLDSPGNAETRFARGLAGGDAVLTFSAGYLGPSGFGLLAAYLLHRDQPDAVLWVGLVLLALFLVLARNLRAFVVTIVLGLLVVGALHTHDSSVVTLTAATWAWILLAGAVIDVFGLHLYRRGERAAGRKDQLSDAAQLARHTWIPAPVWVLVFLVVSFGVLVYGGALLLGTPLDLPFHLPSKAS